MGPLVILPGWGHGRESWEPLIANFAPREVHIIELPGFGAEPLVSSDWGVPEYASWVGEQLASEKYRDVRNLDIGFHLLGHSFGGRVAALLASKGLPGLASLTLYGAPLLYRPHLGTQARGAAAKILKPLLSPFTSAGALVGGELKDAEARGMGTIFRKAVAFDQANTLPTIAAPTLLLSGERDEAVPAALTREAARLIPGSELALLPGLGHNAHIENPTLFAGAVSRFISKHEHPATLR